MTTVITPRVSGVIAASTTKRVTGEQDAIYDAWGGSWAESWGNAWLVHTSLAGIGHTARIAGAVAENTTKRVAI